MTLPAMRPSSAAAAASLNPFRSGAPHVHDENGDGVPTFHETVSLGDVSLSAHQSTHSYLLGFIRLKTNRNK